MWLKLSIIATPVLFWYLFIQPLGELKYIDPPRPQSSHLQVTNVPSAQISSSVSQTNSGNQVIKGTYNCNNNKYDLELEIVSTTDISTGDQQIQEMEVLFQFSPADGRPAALNTGSFMLKGKVV